MKIIEIVAGTTGVGVGTAGAESYMMHPSLGGDRQEARPPQVGYGLRVGQRVDGLDDEPLPTASRRQVIPAPGYQDGDAKGFVGSMVPA